MQKITLGFNMFYEVYTSGNRTIYAPSTDLKRVQRNILNFIKIKYPIKLSIKETAKVHCNQKYILKLDIRRFYESFSKEEIKNVISDIYKNIEFPENYTKNLIYYLATVNDKLPTGAATSSYLAELAFEKTQIDKKLREFAKENNLKYSRYMNDMFFSGSSRINLKKAEKLTIKLLKDSGFNINHEKTQYISDNKRQEILGLVVNNSENCTICCDKKHEYRSMFFNYLKAVYLEERLGINSLFKKKVGLKEVMGHLAYIKATDKAFYEKMKKYLKSRIRNFALYNNNEIKQLNKIIK